MEQYTGWVPKTIGQPIQILYWSATEVVVPLIVFILGAMSGYLVISCVLVALYCVIYSKKKEDIPKGYAINFLYMAGLLNFNTTPTYFSSHFEE